MNDLADLLAPPSEAAAARALRNYVGRVSDTYGKRLASIHLFGSRARGDHRPDSDADLAVILTEFEGSALNEKMQLVDLGFDALTDDGLMIQPWPFTLAQWELRAPGGRFADLLATAKRDGVRLDTAS